MVKIDLFSGFAVAIDPAKTVAEQITSAHQALEDYIVASPVICQYLADLPKGPDASCPDSPPTELAKFMAHRLGDVDWSDVRVTARFLEKVMTRVLDERHELVSLAFAGQELELLWAAADVADAVNVLYLAWLRRVVAPWDDLSEAEKDERRELWKGILPKYDYTCFDQRSTTGLERITWATAFPDEVAEVISALDALHDLMPDQATRIYLDALMDAYEETDVAKLEACWTAVDESWIAIPADAKFVIIHGMENYEHPHGVSPEFRLVMRVTNAEQASEIAAFRRGAKACLTKYGLMGEAWQAAHDKLSRLDVGVFIELIEGGSCLRRRLSGQTIPNRQAVLAKGGKVLLAPPDEAYVETLAATLRHNCTPEATAILVPLLSTVSLERLCIGHEFFHPIGCTPETEAELGPAYEWLEEAKATLGGLAISDDLDSSFETRKRSVATCIALVLRCLHKSRLENPAADEYVRESLVLLSSLHGNDVMGLKPDEGGVVINLSEESVDEFFESVRVVSKSIVTAYQGLNIAWLENIKVGCCGHDDRGKIDWTRDFIAWVNRE